VTSRIDWVALSAKALGEYDLGIVVSHSGETEGMIEYAAGILQVDNVPSIVIVGTRNSTSESMVDIVLYVEMTLLYYDDIKLSLRLAIQALLDII